MMRQEKRATRGFSILLAVTLIIGLMPSMAFADDPVATDETPIADTQNGDTVGSDETVDQNSVLDTSQPIQDDVASAAETDTDEEVASPDDVVQDENTLDEVDSAEPEIAEQSEDAAVAQSDEIALAATAGTIKAQAHVQSIGWQKQQTGSHITIGTTGQGLRMEALKLSLGEGYGAGSGISYQAHVQGIGWQTAASNGVLAGTQGQSLRVEAFKISLTGAAKGSYDIYYRAHIANFGWLDWACNGERVGSAGLSLRMESLEIIVQPKGSPAPGSTSQPFMTPLIKYTTQVQDYGWLSEVHDGALGGTSGNSKRLETLRVSLGDTGYSGGVTYEAYVQDIGWQGEVSNGANAGTVGSALRIEGVRIKLTGDVANYYDVYYRVHVQDIGWMRWVSNWSETGTQGFSMRTEAVEIQLVKKGAAAPRNDGYNKASAVAFGDNGVSMQGAGQNYSWQRAVGNNRTIGTTGQSKRLEAMKISLPGCGSGATQVSGGIKYSAHVSDVGWQSWVSNGAVAGTEGQSRAIECVKIQLTGEAANFYDVYYRAHVASVGWLGWARNGGEAGSTGMGLPVEALKICVVPKGAAAPGSVGGSKISYYMVSNNMALNKAVTNIINNHTGKNLRACFNYVRDMQYRTKQIWPSYSGWWEDYALDMANTHSGNCYSYASLFLFLAKACGYDGAVISGQVPSSRGGLNAHGWCELYINGQTYVFDPDLEHELGINGYWLTYGNAPLRYVK